MARGRKFVLHTASNGEPYFTLVASNGRVLWVTETYSSIQAMMDTLDTMVGKRLPTKIVDERDYSGNV